MEHLEAGALLAAWEAGLASDDRGRALLLHGLARPGTGAGELLSVPVGRRDAELFAVRRALFGTELEVRADCAECGEEMEFSFDAAGLGTDGPGTPPGAPDGPIRVEEGEWTVEFRLPTPADLAAVGTVPGDRARTALLTRCVVRAEHGGRPVTDPDLPDRVQRRMAAASEASDPLADVTLNVTCPDCGKATRAELDIASYLWAELDAWARDTLLDVHLLATAYGWSEPEILALSPLRRRYYLELCADA
ncbi:T4 family baseplate hub assembly chaperone [Streptomyces albireticuli]|uniref:Phage baseplate protein n=1 Tax=Streptomyces albireticuli TaxID=1940 RepID=A0A2A2CY91_9ACTN|nr:hypothetical protein [Streptomyces albireticuli]MCD9145051.1 hypothetical protein [Streptomyces albireticuli]MCD9164477.1 hypothetical protein [Streptomyces albireticuli]MCD9194188.1 hypothetical protein [Streptomyces albireticuli]PAU44129.1 hypothetical protein CK936_36595 [Streptomyces albireticuli]